jgi:sulfite reductase beta subunit-like hemoprotein
MVIFGASGDLTKRKLFPALYSLAYRQLLPRSSAIVGVARTEESDDEFRERMKAAVAEFGRDEFREDVWEWLADGMHYVADSGQDPRGARELDSSRNGTGQPGLLPRCPSSRVRVNRRLGRQTQVEEWLDAPDRGEAVRSRPGVSAAVECTSS